MVQELLRWSCTVKHGTDASWVSPQGETRQAVACVLELMRRRLSRCWAP